MSVLRRSLSYELTLGERRPDANHLLSVKLDLSSSNAIIVSRISVSMGDDGMEIRRVVDRRFFDRWVGPSALNEWLNMGLEIVMDNPSRGTEELVWAVLLESVVRPAFRGEDGGWFVKTFPELSPELFALEERRLQGLAREVLTT